jgi:hypothetical protein
VRIAPGTTAQFTATFNDQPVTATWSIVGTCTGCSISSTGLFTAGSAIESVTVQGRNAADTAQVATAIATVATEVILSVNAPTAPSLTSADMLTFGGSISPEGIENGLAFTTGPGQNAGSVINVEYFFGWLPPSVPGSYTITVASVADPSKTSNIAVQVTAPPDVALVPTAGAPASMRYDHAAAAMPDGRIVLVGGLRDRQAFDPPRATDVFDPQSRAFSAGPTLAVDRVRPEAIAIDANRVLVTGGREEYNLSRNTAEVLNLSTGTAAATANTMTARRIHHGMARLESGPNSGKVLVMGGFNGPIPYGTPTWTATASADLFDPATNTFAASASSMRAARALFTTTVLADGKVLVAGGYDSAPGAGGVASAELYDPVTGAFASTGSMSRARYGHSATRLSDGKVLIVGGEFGSSAPSTAEVYDPAAGTFTVLASTLAVARWFHAAAPLADGRVLVFGGESSNYLVRGTVEAYDPATRTFSLFARMATARTRLTATPLTSGPASGKVLVFGGGARNTPQAAAEITP